MNRAFLTVGSAAPEITLPSVDEVMNLPAEAMPALVGQLAALVAAASARMVIGKTPTSSRLLNVTEASERTGMSTSWLYRHHAALPFSRRIGRKLLFDEVGLSRWQATRPH